MDDTEFQDNVETEIELEEPMTADELGREMDAMVVKESANTNAVLDKLRFKPRNKSKLHIPLCRMKPLDAVRPYLKNDVMALGSHFVKSGYNDGQGVFYVALQDNVGRIVDVSEAETKSWSKLWIEANEAFEAELEKEEAWRPFRGKMFHVWDGNHRLAAWMPIINRDHCTDPTWHYAVESIVLNVEGQYAMLLGALHQVNWYVFFPSCLLLTKIT